MHSGSLHGNPLATMWPKLLEATGMAARRTEVTDFNKEHDLRKRGLSISPGRYGVIRGPGMPARVDIFKDGSIQIAVSGTEIGQGLHTKVAQVCCTVLGTSLGVDVPMTSIHFTDFDSTVIAHHKMSGGSTTSEMACIATEAASKRLVAKIEKGGFVAKARKTKSGNGDSSALTFVEVIAAVYKQEPGLAGFLKVNDMSDLGMALPAFSDVMYDVYGAAVAEVEVDCLTGETKVLAVTLMMDSGPVINPAIDLGQVSLYCDLHF